MTTSIERTNAVVDTRDFLRLLATANDVSVPGLIQSVASALLRHYPLDVDLDISAAALPGIWAPPEPGKRKLTPCRNAQ
ncbi:BPSL0761 family protein [Paraburkholderia agricolaris]|uniref:BPSL0761 family protein n=1 Tax=Paraburkholderia agricolaris TaxID=2152888 RepID=UPI0038BE05F2